MKIKVCGLREPENIKAVLGLGVDYIGLIFFEGSKRYVDDAGLQTWLRENEELFEHTAKVGVFVNAGMDILLNAVHDYQLDYVQLHGDESPGYCRELQLLWSVSTLRKAKLAKAFPIDRNFDFSITTDYTDSCDLFVFDTGGQAEHGGTGVQWDWNKLEEYTGNTPFLLSGGIGPQDARRVRLLEHPSLMGLDLNSKFETSPAVKDTALLNTFFSDIRK